MKFLFRLIFGHFNTGQTICKHQNHVQNNVYALQESRFCLKNDDAKLGPYEKDRASYFLVRTE